jgi:glycosyltransferase involved in cell wall biosynthesis
LTPEPPLVPAEAGGMIRQARLLTRLLDRGHDVTAVACVSAGQASGLGALRDAGARVIAVPRPAGRVAALLAGVVRDPRHVVDVAGEPWTPWKLGFLWALLREPVLQEIAARRPDIVIVEHDSAAGWAEHLPSGLPVVLHCHNVSWAALRGRAALARGARATALAVEARRAQAHAARHLPRYAALVAVSEDDRARLSAVSGAPCAVVPNGAATDEVAVAAPSTGPPTLLFTGTMSHPPNADGARWLAQDVWPLVRRAHPAARLVLAGRKPPPAVRELGTLPGVHVTGAVASMQPYYSRAHVVAVPVRLGGGTRIKALEAFAAGRPVVATRFGVEGIAGIEPGRHVVVADHPETFAAAVARLFDDPVQRAAIAAAARELVAQRYDWRASGDALEAVLERVRAGAP